MLKGMVREGRVKQRQLGVGEGGRSKRKKVNMEALNLRTLAKMSGFFFFVYFGFCFKEKSLYSFCENNSHKQFKQKSTK